MSDRTLETVSRSAAGWKRRKGCGSVLLVVGLCVLVLSTVADLLMGKQFGLGVKQLLGIYFGLGLSGASCLLMAARPADLMRARGASIAVAGAIAMPILIFVLGVAWVFPFKVDDSYISMRYARNLAHGHGLVFNPEGPRVEGYTNFLLVLVEAGLMKLGMRRLWPVKMISVIIGIASLAGIGYYSVRRWPAKLVEESPVLSGLMICMPSLLLGSSAPYILWTPSGLETTLFVFLILAAMIGYVQFLRGQWGGYGLMVTEILFVLAILTRPEGLLFWGLTIGHTLLVGLSDNRRLVGRKRLYSLFLSFALLSAYALFKIRYFGQLLPATFYAKEPDWGFGALLGGGRRFVGFLRLNGNFFLLTVIAAGIVYALWKREDTRHPLWYLLLVGAAYLLYLLSLGFRVTMDSAYRFYVPLIGIGSLLILELSVLLADRAREHQAVWSVGCVVAIAVLLPLRIDELEKAWKVDYNWGIMPYRLAAHDIASGLESGHIALGRWLRNHASEDATIVLYDAGAIPYFSGLRTIDTWSLTDPRLLELRRALDSAGTEDEREDIRGEMRSYVLAHNPEFIVQDHLALLDDPLVRARYRRVDRQFVYQNWYICGERRACRYTLEPWRRQDVQ